MLTVIAITGPGLTQVILLLGILGGIGAGNRVIRSVVITVKQNVYVEAARAVGASNWHTMVKAYPAQRHARRDRRVHAGDGRRHPGRVDPELPGLRHTAADAELGRHAQRPRPELHAAGAVDGATGQAWCWRSLSTA